MFGLFYFVIFVFALLCFLFCLSFVICFGFDFSNIIDRHRYAEQKLLISESDNCKSLIGVP